jgi:hypothetical protein
LDIRLEKTILHLLNIKIEIMQYNNFKEVFNRAIFDRSKSDLLEKIANNPDRYLGIFRPSKPKAKIIQNLLQSHEIRFGDALEEIIEKYFNENGYKTIKKKFIDKDQKQLHVDQFVKKDSKILFIEQKVRDDHDSSKKRGQIQNFEKKLDIIIKEFGSKDLSGIIYFVDNALCKNKKYYKEELKKLSNDYGVELKIFYGNELFDFLELSNSWEEIIFHLTKWKNEIPDFPEINFDLNPEVTLEEIKNIKPLYYRKLFSNEKIISEILPVIFPQNKSLLLLRDYFLTKDETIYKTLAEKINKIL